MRDVSQADDAVSLLKGETYYQDELIKAFRKYCARPDGAPEYEQEIDLFITGTDLDGQERQNWDALGTAIYDKEHRVVFQLQRRPFRKALGYVDQGKAQTKADEQGTILGAIARITSSFPAAFPPFRLEHLDAAHAPYRDAVQTALTRMARSPIEQPERRSFADGGLLDNKPFGPVLEAIFHRMPTDITDRWLFYVEPDPEPRPQPPDPARHNPLNVATDSVAGIPSHESIWGDLQTLERHNAQVRWLKTLKQGWLEVLADPNAQPLIEQTFGNARAPIWAPYRQTRVESLARAFFLASDASTPFAYDDIDRPLHRALADVVALGLREWTAPVDAVAGDPPRTTHGPLLDSFDVDFQLRCSFHVLYELFGTLQQKSRPGAAAYPDCRTAMRLVGRIIKTQKVIRDSMLGLRHNALAQIDATAETSTAEGPAAQWQVRSAISVTNLFRLFLRPDAPHWSALRPDLDRRVNDLRELGERWQEFLSSDALSAVATATRAASDPNVLISQFASDWNDERLATEIVSVRHTILDDLDAALRRVLDTFCRGTEGLTQLADAVDRFSYVDAVLFPLEFVGAVYELDEIDYVRISPQDAQTGLSAGAARDKLAGDELFHFSAFLRKDFRSNDILQGRLDGICQIVKTLLAPTAHAMQRVQRRCRDVGQLFDAARRAELVPGCSEASWERLRAAWQTLAAQLDGTPLPENDRAVITGSPLREAWDGFCTQLAVAGQEDAFRQPSRRLLEDHFIRRWRSATRADPTTRRPVAAARCSKPTPSAPRPKSSSSPSRPSAGTPSATCASAVSRSTAARARPTACRRKVLHHIDLLLWGMGAGVPSAVPRGGHRIDRPSHGTAPSRRAPQPGVLLMRRSEQRRPGARSSPAPPDGRLAGAAFSSIRSDSAWAPRSCCCCTWRSSCGPCRWQNVGRPRCVQSAADRAAARLWRLVLCLAPPDPHATARRSGHTSSTGRRSAPPSAPWRRRSSGSCWRTARSAPPAVVICKPGGVRQTTQTTRNSASSTYRLLELIQRRLEERITQRVRSGAEMALRSRGRRVRLPLDDLPSSGQPRREGHQARRRRRGGVAQY